MWWLGDSLGAVILAAGLALAVAWHASNGHANLLSLILIIAGGCVRAISLWRAGIAGHAAAQTLQSGLRHALHPALLRSRAPRGRMVGEDMHLAVDAVADVEGLAARFLPLRMASGLSPLIIALAVAPASWVVSLILLATLVPFIVAMALAGGAAARQAQAQHQALSRLSGLFVDRLRALPMVLSFSAEERITRHLGGAAQEVARRTMTVLGIAFASSAILEFFAALSVALVAVYCGFSLLGLLPFPSPEHLTLLHAFYALALAPEFYLAMRRLAAAYHDKQQGEAAMASMDEQLSAIPPEPAPIPGIGRWQGCEVVAVHPDGTAIGPLSWDWHGPGLHMLSGPTGSGKSSLLLALVGQVPVGSGAIMADSRPFVPGSLNEHIGWAGQQVALIPGSLRSNLVPDPGQVIPGDEEIHACLARLGLSAMVDSRGGLGALIDHRGSDLSGGERRRIGLARAVLSGRPLLLLDEPTADLDDCTAGTLRMMLGELSKTHLIVAASHDAALIAMASSVCEVAP